PVESAGAADLPEVVEITRRHVGAAEAALLQAWCRHHPEGLSVARDPDGRVQAFGLVVDAAMVVPELRRGDPAAAAMVADLRQRPLRSGGTALLSRQMLTAARGAQPCPELALMTVDLKRTYLEMRPNLMRVYTVAGSGSAMAAMTEALGFVPVAGADAA